MRAGHAANKRITEALNPGNAEPGSGAEEDDEDEQTS
jgi:hypothetical protein